MKYPHCTDSSLFAAETVRLIAKVWTKVFPSNSSDRFKAGNFSLSDWSSNYIVVRLPDKVNLVKIGKSYCFQILMMMMEEKLCLANEQESLKKSTWIHTLHYGFCPLVKFTYKDLVKLTALAAIFKTKTYFR